MAIMQGMVGGSAGARNEGGNYNNEDRILPFCKGVKSIFLSSKSNVDGYILPAFSPELNPIDKAYKTSVGPYRDREVLDPKTDEPEFTNWFFTMHPRQFYGSTNSSFFSPIDFPGDKFDPLTAMYNFVDKQIKEGDKTYAHLIKSKDSSFKDKFLLDYARAARVINVYAKKGDEREYSNQLLVLKAWATAQLEEDLNTTCRPKQVGLDPEWEDYVLGDITNPKHAVRFGIKMYPPRGDNKGGSEWPGLVFGNLRNGAGLETGVIPKDVLAKRYIVNDDEVVHVTTPLEILMLALRDGLPYELAERVCSERMSDFPAQEDIELFPNPIVTPNIKKRTYTASRSAAPEPEEEEAESYTRSSSLRRNVGMTSADEDEDEEDDIPMDDPAPEPVPAYTPEPAEKPRTAAASEPEYAPDPAKPKAAATSGLAPLTPEEEARRKVLLEKALNEEATTQEQLELSGLQKRFRANR